MNKCKTHKNQFTFLKKFFGLISSNPAKKKRKNQTTGNVQHRFTKKIELLKPQLWKMEIGEIKGRTLIASQACAFTRYNSII